MAEIALQIEELVEQGMTAKFISVTLNVPLSWAEYAIEERYELEMQKTQQYYGDE